MRTDAFIEGVSHSAVSYLILTGPQAVTINPGAEPAQSVIFKLCYHHLKFPDLSYGFWACNYPHLGLGLVFGLGLALRKGWVGMCPETRVDQDFLQPIKLHPPAILRNRSSIHHTHFARTMMQLQGRLHRWPHLSVDHDIGDFVCGGGAAASRKDSLIVAALWHYCNVTLQSTIRLCNQLYKRGAPCWQKLIRVMHGMLWEGAELLSILALFASVLWQNKG